VATERPEACIPFEEDLSALIDEELSPARDAEVRAHLDACDRCALRLQELCNVDLELAGMAPPTASAELARGLEARIANDAQQPAPEAPSPREPGSLGTTPSRARRRWLGSASLARVALAAGLALAAWLLLRGDDGGVPEPPEARIARVSPEAPVAPESVPAPDAPREERIAALPEPPATDTRPRASTSGAALSEVPVEDLAMLLELQEVEDLDLIANLELLETLVELERDSG
jgi:anti-sigma factor RsiW